MDQFCTQICNMAHGYCNPDQCICDESEYDAASPIEDKPIVIPPNKMAEKSHDLINRVKLNAATRMGLPDCLWRPGHGAGDLNCTSEKPYECIGGKMNRGLMVVETGVVLFEAQGKAVTNDDLCRFAVLGWIIEMLQAWLLVADDMKDSSLTRRGQPCWYKVDGVGPMALNDAFLIEMVMFKVLKRHFGDAPEYAKLLDLLMETTLQTELGQLLDLQCDRCDLDKFTLDRWTMIVKYKTAFYSFYLPVAMAMVCVRGRVWHQRRMLSLRGSIVRGLDPFVFVRLDLTVRCFKLLEESDDLLLAVELCRCDYFT